MNNSDFRYYVDGILVSSCGILGFIGNVLTIIVLSTKKFQDCFHQLLLTLACYDTVYIFFGSISYACRALNGASSKIYTVLFPYLIHPLSYIGMTGSVFMTLAISIERFLGICYPLKFPPHRRKAWFYIIPVTVFSISTNIPRFLESNLLWSDKNNVTNVKYGPSALRTSEEYIKIYKTYFTVPILALLPFLSVLVLNVRMIWDLRYVKVQRFGSSKQLKKEVTFFLILLSIAVAFIILHSLRIIVDVYEFLNLEAIIKDIKSFRPSDAIKKLTYVSHLTTILNSGINFLIYSCVGNSFRQELRNLLGCNQQQQSEWSQRRGTALSYLSSPSSKRKTSTSRSVNPLSESECVQL